MLAEARTSPDFVNYLTYIFASSQLPDLGLSSGTLFSVRYSAAVNLKNHIKLAYSSIPEESLAYVKTSVLSTLQDTNPQLRSFAGTVITEIVQKGGLLQWPEILQELIGLVSNSGGNVPSEAQEGAMSALAKVCEDNRKTAGQGLPRSKADDSDCSEALKIHGQLERQDTSLSPSRHLKSFIPQKSQALFSQLDVVFEYHLQS